MNYARFRVSLVILSVIAVIAVNTLANVLPLNGQTTGEISDRFRVLFVPAGYVFSIWGIIYLGLISYGSFQSLPSQRRNPRLEGISYLFVISSAANIAWLVLWHYEVFPLTLIAMGALLLTLIAIYLRLGTGKYSVPAAESWLVRVPFSIYLGWITVASVANVATVLVYYNWNGWGISAEAWTILMLLVAAALAAAVGLTRGDAAYMLVIVWAFAGIAIKQSETEVVSTVAWVLAVLVIAATAAVIVRGRAHRPLAR